MGGRMMEPSGDTSFKLPDGHAGPVREHARSNAHGL